MPSPTIQPVVPEDVASAEVARKVLKKIDRVVITIAFFCYVFNFADKIILSSAAVFGLREDNVSWPCVRSLLMPPRGLRQRQYGPDAGD